MTIPRARFFLVLLAAAAFAQLSDEAARRDAYEVELHNDFAKAYNAYAAERGRGVFDLAALRKARRAWARLEADGGWPKERK